MGRSYRLARRAELVDETRRRIVEAAMALHGTVGPARTTISAVAERAGVQRLTVYRHFPDEAALFQACSGQWLADHPPPDPAAWAAEANPRARLRRALRDLYAYFAGTAAMWERVYRDGPVVPALREPMAAWEAYLDRAREVIVEPWPVTGRRRRHLAVAVGHALGFATWASFTRLGADLETAIDLMTALVQGAADREEPTTRRRAARHRSI
jgi:AcrR family transcriptional regulator